MEINTITAIICVFLTILFPLVLSFVLVIAKGHKMEQARAKEFHTKE